MSKIFVAISCVLLFCCSCKKETGVAGPAGPAGNNGQDGILLDTGTISGNLAVYDEFSYSMHDSAGVGATLYLNGVAKSTTSDASGNYFFHGLPAGTYNLSYVKANFGTMKVFAVEHSPGSNLNTVMPEVYLIQTPVKTAVDSIRLDSASSYVIVHIYLDTSSIGYTQYQYNFAVFVSKDPNPGPSNTSPSAYNEFIQTDGNGAYSLFLDRSVVGGVGKVGGQYYINVGTYNRYLRKFQNAYSTFDPGFGSYYVDPANGKFVYPNLKLAPKPVAVR